MLSLIVNIVFGYILETLFFGYAFNKIKGIKSKRTYIIFLICYVLGAIIINFTINNVYYLYIMIAFMFEIINKIIDKRKFIVTNAFLMLNIMLLSSTITTIPILLFGYNSLSLILNRAEIIIMIILIKYLPINKIHKLVVSNWNRTANNKVKSVTIRNLILIVIFILITIINMFINNILMNIYQSIL